MNAGARRSQVQAIFRSRKETIVRAGLAALLILCLACCQSLQGTMRREAFRSLTAEGSFAKIPPGQFLMGSPPGRGANAAEGLQQESPQHRVSITCAFEIGRYEVTQKQWESVMSSNPSAFKGPDLPVTNVSWRDVQEFLARLRKLDARFVYRLPTEAEWEYACRAGSSGSFSGEAAATDLQRLAWYEANSLNRPHAVGHLQPNGWGLYDIHGNVWEWVQDWYDINYYRRSPAENPQGPPGGQSKVQRGGSWQSPAGQCRAAVRGYSLPAERNNLTGCRLVRVPR